MTRDDDVFADALEMPEGERPAFLARACSHDAGQQARVEALLRGHGRAPACFDAPPTPLPATEKAGDQIGRYKLLEQIGEGGCGVVWMAEQSEPVRRRVALKVIKLGMDTREVIARFEAERQALAMMDHPNIATILDAGATDAGRPFFVMELVRGIPITRFCDEASLPTTERLQLFISVCHAIQHAHQKGVIHRDIKPSNILVTLHDDVAVPKVIDFGIAKATQGRLTDQTVFTAFEQFIGTPAYMSPEQAGFNALDVDTRSDVYSLGVLLYELLTGRPPFDPKTLVAGGLEQIRRVIREVDPPRPSTRLSTLGQNERLALAQRRGIASAQLSTTVRGDLDWIVMKSLEKSRIRRYESASAFATDLQRYLGHEPIAARPPSQAYLLQKLVRRHRVAFGVTAALAVVLVLGATVSIWQAIRATRAEQVAQRGEQEQSRLRAVEAVLRGRAEAQALIMRRRAYTSDMQLAQQSHASDNLSRTQDLLNRQRPKPGETDLRGWEWRHLWQRSRGQETFSLRPDNNPASCVVFSPDGRTFVTGGGGQVLKVWSTSSHQLLASLPESTHPSRPHSSTLQNSICFSRDGNLLAFSDLARVVIWETTHWQVMTRLPTDLRPGEFIHPVFFSPDGKILAALSGPGIQFWDTHTGERRNRLEPEHMPHGLFCLSDDWKFLAIGGQNQREIWDAVTLTKLDQFPGWTVSLKFAPGSSLLAVGDYEGNVVLWNAAARQEVKRWKAHRSAIRAVNFSPDGKVLTTGGQDHVIRRWEVATQRSLSTLTGHQGWIWGLTLSPDGQNLASASEDGTVKFWNTTPGAEDQTLKQTSTPLWFSPDARVVATIATTGVVQYWDVATRHLIRTVPPVVELNSVSDLRMAPDGKTVAILRPRAAIELWDLESRLRIATLPNDEKFLVQNLVFSPDQRWLASAHEPRSAGQASEGRLWNLVTHQLDSRFPMAGAAMAFSPDSKILATRGARGALQLWETATLRGGSTATDRGVRNFKSGGGFYILAFSPDGKLLAGGGKDATRIWDVTSGMEIAEMGGHVGGIFAVTFSPDGKTLVTGSIDATVKFWNTATWQELMTLPEYGKSASRLMFSPDGLTLAVGSSPSENEPGPVQLWRAPALAEIDVADSALP